MIRGSYMAIPGARARNLRGALNMSKEKADDMKQMRKEGKTLEEIAAKYNTSIYSIWKYTNAKDGWFK